MPRVIPEDSPEAHCLNDLDFRVWKVIADRRHGIKGLPEWYYYGELGRTGRAELNHEIHSGRVITITGTYGERQLLFAKRPRLTP